MMHFLPQYFGQNEEKHLNPNSDLFRDGGGGSFQVMMVLGNTSDV